MDQSSGEDSVRPSARAGNGPDEDDVRLPSRMDQSPDASAPRASPCPATKAHPPLPSPSGTQQPPPRTKRKPTATPPPPPPRLRRRLESGRLPSPPLASQNPSSPPNPAPVPIEPPASPWPRRIAPGSK
ncbi:hypothetical protein ZWY2020_022924 [Hordeum vulgare]|nr:hypothetical protein ZWY2020_022924 [Hordeum vulgare]